MGLLQNLPQIFVTWKDVNWTFNSCLILQFLFLSLKRQALYISFYKHLFSIESLFLFFLKIT